MNVKILHLLKGARKAEGLTVIIDVFRAFSTACYLYQNGAKIVIPVKEIKLAKKLKQNNPEFILIGERDGKILEGFDYGNSPHEIQNVDFNSKIVVLTTSSGTQGIYSADKAEEIITGSFVNLSSIVKYIKLIDPPQVSLVCMGIAGRKKAEEDILCAKTIKDKLKGNNPDYKSIKERLKNTAGKRFFNYEKNWFPEEDFHLCLKINKFNFILKVNKEAGDLLFLKKVNI